MYSALDGTETKSNGYLISVLETATQRKHL